MANDYTNSKTPLDKANDKKANRDPITGEPGSHPVATGIGAAVGAATGVVGAMAMGAAAGAPLGPAGAIAGAAAGGILGGGIGHGIGEDIRPTQLAWWKANYSSRPYITEGKNFDTYEPAYRYGIDTAIANKNNVDRDFNTLEPNLRNNWNIARGKSSMEWDEAKYATRDAFEKANNRELIDEDI